MKKYAIVFAFFSVILASCSQLKETVMASPPIQEPPKPRIVEPALPVAPPPLENYVRKDDFAKFQQQLIPKPELEKFFQTQQSKVEELNRNLAALQKTAVAKPELVKAQEQMVSMTHFMQFAAEQQDTINDLKRQNQALRDISKDMVNNAAKISELRCDALWYKIKIALVTALLAIFALIGIIYFKLSRHSGCNCGESENSND